MIGLKATLMGGGGSLSKPTKAQQDLIYQNTHSDYKWVYQDGTRAILVCRGATTIVALQDLTPDEVTQRLASYKRK